MALVDRYFRVPGGMVQKLSVDEEDPLVIPEGWTLELDGASIQAAQAAAAVAHEAESAAVAAADQQARALERLATLEVIADATGLTVDAVVNALAGTAADWQVLVVLLQSRPQAQPAPAVATSSAPTVSIT